MSSMSEIHHSTSKVKTEFGPPSRRYTFPFRSERDYFTLGEQLSNEQDQERSNSVDHCTFLQAESRAQLDFQAFLGAEYSIARERSPRVDASPHLPEAFGRPRPKDIYLTEDTPDTFKLALDYPLQQGFSRWSQVWTCVPYTEENHGNAFLVVKLFQECFFPWPEDYSDAYAWQPAETLVHREAWAYTKLKSLQGTLVPHSYGFYNFLLPSGLSVVGHVMEYIEGSYLFAYARRNGGRENILLHNSLMLRVARAMHEIHACGVAAIDFRFQNVLVPKADGDGLVVFDFASARLPKLCVESGGTLDPILDDVESVHDVWCTIDTMRGCDEWLRQGLASGGEPWLAQLFPEGRVREHLLRFSKEHLQEDWANECRGDEWTLPDSDSDSQDGGDNSVTNLNLS